MTLVLTADSTAPLGVRWAEYVPPYPPLLINMVKNPQFDGPPGATTSFARQQIWDPEVTSLTNWSSYHSAGGAAPTLTRVADASFQGGNAIDVTINDVSAAEQGVVYSVPETTKVSWATVVTALTFQTPVALPDISLTNSDFPTSSNRAPGKTASHIRVPSGRSRQTGITAGGGTSTTGKHFLLLINASGLAAGTTFRIGEPLVGTMGPNTGPSRWWDGFTTDPDVHTILWEKAGGTGGAPPTAGVPHASYSNSKDATTAGGYDYGAYFYTLSSQWSVSGQSARVPGGVAPQDLDLQGSIAEDGRVYTALATVRHNGFPTNEPLVPDGYRALAYIAGSNVQAVQIPDAAGVYELRLVFTTRSRGELTLGGDLIADTWWDNVLVVEGDYQGPYFDGDTPDTSGVTYSWDGTPHASSSRRVAGSYVFKVTDIPGVLAWIEPATAPFADGEPILVYRDATGREFGADGAAPTFRTFPNRIEFDGGGLVAPDVNLGSDGLTFVAVSQVDAPSGSPIITWGTADLGYDEADPTGTPNLHIERVESGVRTDTVVNATLTQSEAGIQVAGPQDLSIGTGFTGTILEAVVFAGPISDYDLGQLTDYLANKYELTGV